MPDTRIDPDSDSGSDADAALDDEAEHPFRTYLTDADTVTRRIAPCLSLPSGVPLYTAFRCAMPHTHNPRAPNAFLVRSKRSGIVVYQDQLPVSRGKQARRQFSLGAVYASQHYGDAVLPRSSELGAWTARLLIESGVVEAVPVSLPPLPPGLRPIVYRVRDGFALLLAAKWTFYPPEPTTFAYSFGRAWCVVGSDRDFGYALNTLLRHGVIRREGAHDYFASSGFRRAPLYLPGDGTAATH